MIFASTHSAFCAMAFTTVLAANSIACGSTATIPTADAGADVAGQADTGAVADGAADGGDQTCGSLNRPGAIGALSLQLMGIDFGDRAPVESGGTSSPKTTGANIDGLCSTRQSVDVCTPDLSAPPDIKVDGNNGIDNAFGKILLPTFNQSKPVFSSNALYAALVVDAAGSGTLMVDSGIRLYIPVRDAAVVRNANGSGVLSARIETAAFSDPLRQYFGGISGQACKGTLAQTIQDALIGAQDMPLSGPQVAGAMCKAVSLGMKFDSSTPQASPLPAPMKYCP
jgi:hypothetical protein